MYLLPSFGSLCIGAPLFAVIVYQVLYHTLVLTWPGSPILEVEKLRDFPTGVKCSGKSILDIDRQLMFRFSEKVDAILCIELANGLPCPSLRFRRKADDGLNEFFHQRMWTSDRHGSLAFDQNRKWLFVVDMKSKSGREPDWHTSSFIEYYYQVRVYDTGGEGVASVVAIIANLTSRVVSMTVDPETQLLFLGFGDPNRISIYNYSTIETRTGLKNASIVPSLPCIGHSEVGLSASGSLRQILAIPTVPTRGDGNDSRFTCGRLVMLRRSDIDLVSIECSAQQFMTSLTQRTVTSLNHVSGWYFQMLTEYSVISMTLFRPDSCSLSNRTKQCDSQSDDPAATTLFEEPLLLLHHSDSFRYSSFSVMTVDGELIELDREATMQMHPEFLQLVSTPINSSPLSTFYLCRLQKLSEFTLTSFSKPRAVQQESANVRDAL